MQFQYEIIQGTKTVVETTLLARKSANRALDVLAMCWDGSQFCILVSYVTP